MAIFNKTIYAYEPSTGILSYTIDNPTSDHIKNLRDRKITFHIDSPGKFSPSAYVTKNAITGQTESIAPVQHINFVQVSNNVLVANGTDVVLVSNLVSGSVLEYDGESFTANNTDNSVEFTANGISANPNENYISFKVSCYGYYSKNYTIALTGVIQ